METKIDRLLNGLPNQDLWKPRYPLRWRCVPHGENGEIRPESKPKKTAGLSNKMGRVRVCSPLEAGAGTPREATDPLIELQVAHFYCIFNFEGRVVNVEAHSLAKHSLSLCPGRLVWFGQTYDLNCIPHSVAFAE